MQGGETLNNRYRIERLLGHGGMADVYLAFDTRRQTYLAVKILHEDLAEDPEFVRRFQREAETLARLDHPNIVRFYSFERSATPGGGGVTAFIVMDYIAGTTLRGRLAESNGPLPLNEASAVLHQVGAALQYAHSQGFVHRDIKPGNIMLRESGDVLLSDFGIARAAEVTTMTAGPLGTPAYMAPEQILGQSVGPWTDVYSLGVVLYEMLAGRRPFTGESGTGTGTSERVRYQHLHQMPPDPRLFNPQLPGPVVAVILRTLAKEPSQRWPDVASLIQAWDAAAGPWTAEGAGHARPAVAAPQPSPVAIGTGWPGAAPTSPAPVSAASGKATGVPLLAIGGAVAALFGLALIAGAFLLLRGRSAASGAVSGGSGSPTPASLALGSTTAATTWALASPQSPPTATGTALAATATRPLATPTPAPAASATVTAMPVATAAPASTSTPMPTDTPAPPPTEPPTAVPTATPTLACPQEPAAQLAPAWERGSLGCPVAPASTVWSAWETFQGGAMYWRSDADQASAFYNDGTWTSFSEKWNGSDNPSRGTPPSGLQAPVRGFNFIWGTRDDVFSRLGWATDQEKGFCADIQPFEHGLILRSNGSGPCQDGLFNWATDPAFGQVFMAVYDDGTWRAY